MDGPQADLERLTRDLRRSRPPTPRALWIVSTLVGLGCVVAFVIGMLTDATPPPTTSPGQEAVALASGHRSFWVGILIGCVCGIAIGIAIATHRHSSRNRP